MGKRINGEHPGYALHTWWLSAQDLIVDFYTQKEICKNTKYVQQANVTVWWEIAAWRGGGVRRWWFCGSSCHWHAKRLFVIIDNPEYNFPDRWLEEPRSIITTTHVSRTFWTEFGYHQRITKREVIRGRLETKSHWCSENGRL